MRYDYQPSDCRDVRPRQAAAAGWPPRLQPGVGAALSSIAASLLITGSLKSADDIEVDGEIVGDVSCADLIIGKGAQISGRITARQVVVRGRVAGSIRAERIFLQHTACVDADLYPDLLTIEEGAIFNGNVRLRARLSAAAAPIPLVLTPAAEAVA
jgi:cytoskeletal protein CcmA (bactofilin family)